LDGRKYAISLQRSGWNESGGPGLPDSHSAFLTELTDELRLLALGQYFADAFKDRASDAMHEGFLDSIPSESSLFAYLVINYIALM
jgi:hypothetical protein